MPKLTQLQKVRRNSRLRATVYLRCVSLRACQKPNERRGVATPNLPELHAI